MAQTGGLEVNLTLDCGGADVKSGSSLVGHSGQDTSFGKRMISPKGGKV